MSPSAQALVYSWILGSAGQEDVLEVPRWTMGVCLIGVFTLVYIQMFPYIKIKHQELSNLGTGRWGVESAGSEVRNTMLSLDSARHSYVISSAFSSRRKLFPGL